MFAILRVRLPWNVIPAILLQLYNLLTGDRYPIKHCIAPIIVYGIIPIHI